MEICDWWFIVKVNKLHFIFIYPKLMVMAELHEISGQITYLSYLSRILHPLFKKNQSNQPMKTQYFTQIIQTI